MRRGRAGSAERSGSAPQCTESKQATHRTRSARLAARSASRSRALAWRRASFSTSFSTCRAHSSFLQEHGLSHAISRQLRGAIPQSRNPASSARDAAAAGSTWSTRRQTTRATSASTPGGTLRRSPVPLGPERALALHALRASLGSWPRRGARRQGEGQETAAHFLPGDAASSSALRLPSAASFLARGVPLPTCAARGLGGSGVQSTAAASLAGDGHRPAHTASFAGAQGRRTHVLLPTQIPGKGVRDLWHTGRPCCCAAPAAWAGRACRAPFPSAGPPHPRARAPPQTGSPPVRPRPAAPPAP